MPGFFVAECSEGQTGTTELALTHLRITIASTADAAIPHPVLVVRNSAQAIFSSVVVQSGSGVPGHHFEQHSLDRWGH